LRGNTRERTCCVDWSMGSVGVRAMPNIDHSDNYLGLVDVVDDAELSASRRKRRP
jgi:hypothetical protein